MKTENLKLKKILQLNDEISKLKEDRHCVLYKENFYILTVLALCLLFCVQVVGFVEYKTVGFVPIFCIIFSTMITSLHSVLLMIYKNKILKTMETSNKKGFMGDHEKPVVMFLIKNGIHVYFLLNYTNIIYSILAEKTPYVVSFVIPLLFSYMIVFFIKDKNCVVDEKSEESITKLKKELVTQRSEILKSEKDMICVYEHQKKEDNKCINMLVRDFENKIKSTISIEEYIKEKNKNKNLITND